MSTTLTPEASSPRTTDKRARHWGNLFSLSILMPFLYVFMEWLFFVTKESSLSQISLWESIQVLFIIAGIFALGSLATALVLMPMGFGLKSLIGQRVFLLVGSLIPAGVLSITALIMMDNFTYTLFGFGIVSTHGLWRLVYAIGFIVFFFFGYRSISKAVLAKPRKRKTGVRIRNISSLILLLASVTAIGLTVYAQKEHYSDLLDVYSSMPDKRPNIIILGSDGLSSSHLSLYGYERDTTPFLRQLADSSLVAQNAFTNASSTTASTTSVLTGKPPVEANVMRYPDILKGDATFEHMPGILEKYGYTTVEVGVPYWVDAKTLNMVGGFESVNNEALEPPSLTRLRRILGDSQAPYFLWTIGQRVRDRVLHIFMIREMANPIETVMDPKSRMTDQQRVDRIISLIDKSNTPLFIFAHFMDTHGPTFSPQEQIYSDGNSADHPWSGDFYDDSIIGFDKYVKQIYNRLEETGLLDNTILVVYTDHGLKYVTNTRIPILMRFPNGEHAGNITHNVQNMDIPVTLLDYMGVDKPDWMTGYSLIEGEPPLDREIISIIAGSPKNVVAPFYQIKIFQVIVCHKWYQLNVQQNSWVHGTISGYKDPVAECSADKLPDPEEIHRRIIQYLKNHDYDVSSLYQ